MFVDGREVHDALKKARHVCERRRDVRRRCPVSAQGLNLDFWIQQIHETCKAILTG
jgi:hypothetical protein